MRLATMAVMIVLALGCTRQPVDNCPHRWGKWEASGRHNGWNEPEMCRTCETCGWMQLEFVK
jgi:hypothetical protein